jgi:hypothetical protein
MLRSRMHLRWLAGAYAILNACSNSAASSAADARVDRMPPVCVGEAGVCSTGDAEPPGESTTGEQTEPTDPACVPRCGSSEVQSTYGLEYLTSALPAGACPCEGDICAMSATPYQVCGGVTEACARSTYRCHCTSGQWACVATVMGKGACFPCRDGGV